MQGVSAIHRWFKLAPYGYGKMIVTRSCRNLIRALPAMTYDKSNPKDIDPACEEHAVKALMYGLTKQQNRIRFLKVTGL